MILMQGHPGKSLSYHQIWSRMVKPDNDIHMEISSTRNKDDFFRAVCKGEIRAFSDASYMPQYSSSIAAAEWRVETTQESCSWKGSGLFRATYNSSYVGKFNDISVPSAYRIEKGRYKASKYIPCNGVNF